MRCSSPNCRGQGISDCERALDGCDETRIRISNSHRRRCDNARPALRATAEKTRYREEFEGHRWEVDEFHGDNSGLVIAEIELANASEPFAMPPWAAAEVSDDPRYFNANLVSNPYKNWRT